jgi:hypothetical protein
MNDRDSKNLRGSRADFFVKRRITIDEIYRVETAENLREDHWRYGLENPAVVIESVEPNQRHDCFQDIMRVANSQGLV